MGHDATGRSAVEGAVRGARNPLQGAVACLVAPLLAASALAFAQPAAKAYRVGWLGPGSAPPVEERGEGDFRVALKDLGYVEGRNLVVEYRYAGGDVWRLPQLAKELADDYFLSDSDSDRRAKVLRRTIKK